MKFEDIKLGALVKVSNNPGGQNNTYRLTDELTLTERGLRIKIELVEEAK